MSKQTTYLVLDTNLFYGLPFSPEHKLSLLIDRARRLGWTLGIPEPVHREVINNAQASMREVVKKLGGPLDQVKKLGLVTSLPKIDEKTMCAAYFDKLKELISQNQIIELPFPSKVPTYSDLFNLAIKKAPPFDPKGQSFRDTIIWYSVKEFSEANSQSSVYFVSADAGFVERSSVLVDKAGKIKCLNYEDAVKELTTHLSAKLRAHIEKLSEKIEKYIQVNLVSKLESEITEIKRTNPPIFLNSWVGKIFGFKADSVNVNAVIEGEGVKRIGFKLLVGGNLNCEFTVLSMATPEDIVPPQLLGGGGILGLSGYSGYSGYSGHSAFSIAASGQNWFADTNAFGEPLGGRISGMDYAFPTIQLPKRANEESAKKITDIYQNVSYSGECVLDESGNVKTVSLVYVPAS